MLDFCDHEAVRNIQQISQQQGIDLRGGKIRRTSSRFCLGVEHGDYKIWGSVSMVESIGIFGEPGNHRSALRHLMHNLSIISLIFLEDLQG